MEQQSEEYRVAMRDARKTYLDAREGMLKASDGDRASRLPKRGKTKP